MEVVRVVVEGGRGGITVTTLCPLTVTTPLLLTPAKTPLCNGQCAVVACLCCRQWLSPFSIPPVPPKQISPFCGLGRLQESLALALVLNRTLVRSLVTE